VIHALLALIGFWLVVFALFKVWRKQVTTSSYVLGAFGIGFLLWFFLTDSVPSQFAGMTPYIATLLVLAFASQRLRMPKADGLVYRKGAVG
jgi:simple sugar transport system permease protein